MLVGREVMEETPVEWCRRMQDEAPTGEIAMDYYRLAQMWMSREDKDAD